MKTDLRMSRTSLLIALSFAVAACNSNEVPSDPTATGRSISSTHPGLPDATEEAPSSEAPARSWRTDALIYNGTGTSQSDTDSVEDIIGAAGLTFRTVTSAELNAMSQEEITEFGVILWPGGVAKTMSDSLTSTTRERIKIAVSRHGVGFVGFCAGAFIAGTYSGWGLKLTSHAFPFAYPYYQTGTSTMVDLGFADGSSRNVIWIGGPHLSSFGQVIAKYKDGTSAIAQTEVGAGLVILSGPHPEAPASWASSYGLRDTDGVDHELTLELIEAALHHQKVAAF